jgi:hypothetical protein
VISQHGEGRPRKFCSDSCRTLAYRHRKRASATNLKSTGPPKRQSRPESQRTADDRIEQAVRAKIARGQLAAMTAAETQWMQAHPEIVRLAFQRAGSASDAGRPAAVAATAAAPPMRKAPASSSRPAVAVQATTITMEIFGQRIEAPIEPPASCQHRPPLPTAMDLDVGRVWVGKPEYCRRGCYRGGEVGMWRWSGHQWSAEGTGAAMKARQKAGIG